jgi:hypothetical protein
MPVAVKPYICVNCRCEDPSLFYLGKKSWCKKCYPNSIKGLALKEYKCKICGTEKEKYFYKYLKSICIDCNREKKKKKTIKIRILSYEEVDKREVIKKESSSEEVKKESSFEELKIVIPRKRITSYGDLDEDTKKKYDRLLDERCKLEFDKLDPEAQIVFMDEYFDFF